MEEIVTLIKANLFFSVLSFIGTIWLIFNKQVCNFFEKNNPKCPCCNNELFIKPDDNNKLTYKCHHCD